MFATRWDQTSNDTSGAATIELAPVFGASLEACGELSSSLEAYSAPRSTILAADSKDGEDEDSEVSEASSAVLRL